MSSHGDTGSSGEDASLLGQSRGEGGNAMTDVGHGSQLGQHAENVGNDPNVGTSMHKEADDQQRAEEFDDTFKDRMRTAANLFAELAKDPQFTRFLNAPKKDSKGKEKKTPSTASGQPQEPKEMPKPSLEEPKMPDEHKQLVPVGQQVQMHGQLGSANPWELGQQGNYAHESMGQQGYFGGGTIFHAMVGQAPHTGMYGTNPYGMQQPMHGSQHPMYPGNASGMHNPMYGSIGMMPGAQSGPYGYVSAPPGTVGAQGFRAGHVGASDSAGLYVNTANAPFLQQPIYDNLTPIGPTKDYDEGGKSVKFETFSGAQDRLKALVFIQQFDAAYSGGNFTEASKIRKAATFLKGNALQWWSTLLIQGKSPTTWVQFKQMFASNWLTSTFEVDIMTAWNQLNSKDCKNLDQYNKKFWDALLPVTSYRTVPLHEQVEKYICGLPKGIRDFCIKSTVSSMS